MTAVATDGHKVTQTSTFERGAAQTFSTQIFEGYHQTYGVMPSAHVQRAITNKIAVEEAMQISTSKPW